MNCPSICKRKLWAPKSGFFINLQSRRKRGTCRGQGGKHSPVLAGIEKTRFRRGNLKFINGSPRFLDPPPVLIGQCQCREMWINFRFAIQCSSGIHTLKRWQKPDSPLTPHTVKGREVINIVEVMAVFIILCLFYLDSRPIRNSKYNIRR